MTTWYDNESVADLYSTRTNLRASEAYLFERYFKPGADVLDLGCGTGRTTLPLVDRGCRVVAGDIAMPMLVRARALRPELDWRLLDATRLELADRSFDIVFFSFNGIDGIFPRQERHRCLREMARVVRPGGLVIFSAHNLVARALLRFRTSFIFGIKANYWELREQRGNERWRAGYLRHRTEEGVITVYMGTVPGWIAQVKRAAPALTLTEIVGQTPSERWTKAVFSSPLVYYVWRAKGSA